MKIIWTSQVCNWQYLMIDWGVRNSKQWQLFPIKNVSNNTQRAIMFGIWKIHFTITYQRKSSFNQNRKLPLRRLLWKFYQLLF